MSGSRHLSEWNDILAQGFPEDPIVLHRMPFGDDMAGAHNKTDSSDSTRYLHREHLVKMVNEMNSLLVGDFRKVIRDWDSTEGAFVVGAWTNAWGAIHDNRPRLNHEEQCMWRLEAFLHDVGKSLTHAKHPTRGQYLVTRLRPDEKKRVIDAIGEERFDQIKKVIALHDRMGVLSTGEASFGILTDALDRKVGDSTSKEDTTVSKAAQTISHIMVLNLIDIGASVRSGLMSSKVDVILRDWRNACWDDRSPLRMSEGDRGQFEGKLLELASKDEWTIDRIARLLAESYRRACEVRCTERDFEPSRWPEPGRIDFTSAARQALDTQLDIRWDEFVRDFAHVVKMDYLLYLADRITKVHWDKYADPDSLAASIVGVIHALVEHFSDLIRRGDQRRRIGIDLSVLRDTPAVQDQIAILLSGNNEQATNGLRWLTHEASAWPF